MARTTIIRGSAGGFITGVGGFSPCPWLPVNVVEFHVQAARMVSAIAILRGHDVGDSQVRKAVLRTLVRTQPTRCWSRPLRNARRRADKAMLRSCHPAPCWWPARGSASPAARHH